MPDRSEDPDPTDSKKLSKVSLTHDKQETKQSKASFVSNDTIEDKRLAKIFEVNED